MTRSGLTSRTWHVIRTLFSIERHQCIERVLIDDCGPVQVHSPDFDETAMERIRLAVLKRSGGDPSRFDAAVRLAQTDWRDLLVGAGFGDDAAAHCRWADSLAG